MNACNWQLFWMMSACAVASDGMAGRSGPQTKSPLSRCAAFGPPLYRLFLRAFERRSRTGRCSLTPSAPACVSAPGPASVAVHDRPQPGQHRRCAHSSALRASWWLGLRVRSGEGFSFRLPLFSACQNNLVLFRCVPRYRSFLSCVESCGDTTLNHPVSECDTKNQ